MSGRYSYTVATGSVALSASATKSLWLLDPVTEPFTICEFGLSFDSVSPATAIRVDLYCVTNVGSAAGSSGTVNNWQDQRGPNNTTTALTNLTTEPTGVDILSQWFVQPFGGCLVIQYPLQREPGTAATATTNRLGLRCVTPSGTSCNSVSYVVFEET